MKPLDHVVSRFVLLSNFIDQIIQPLYRFLAKVQANCVESRVTPSFPLWNFQAWHQIYVEASSMAVRLTRLETAVETAQSTGISKLQLDKHNSTLRTHFWFLPVISRFHKYLKTFFCDTEIVLSLYCIPPHQMTQASLM